VRWPVALASACKSDRRAYAAPLIKLELEMTFTIPWLAVIVAAVSFFIFGAVWYSYFGEFWLQAIGKRKEDLNQKDPMPYITAAIASFLNAMATAFVINLVIPLTTTTIMTVFLVGLLLGGAVFAAALAKHYSFAERSWNLFMLDAGHEILGFMLMSLIIVLMR